MAAIPDTELSVETCEAKQFFLDQARDLPGVVRVETFGGATLPEQSFIIYVPEGDVETEMRIYELKIEVYQRYPDAYLDVWVDEVTNSCTSPTASPASTTSAPPPG